jgi:glycine/D-amino acid oxidase-like deaminating enzyme
MVAPLATQLEDGRLLAGGTLDIGDATAGVRTDVTDRIRAELAAALPLLARVRLTHRWCCWRPRHPDGLPVIDRLPGLGNAWITSGHYRTGILMARRPAQRSPDGLPAASDLLTPSPGPSTGTSRPDR